MPTNDNSSPTSSNWLHLATTTLYHAGISTARLDALVLLEDTTGKDRSHLLAHPEMGLTQQQISELNKKIAQRTKHIPLAYIREQTEFYGRTFYINQHVLEPRPESETMIELLKQLVKSKKLKVKSGLSIVDVGTGSGALAITAKLELPAATVHATDIDKRCLEVAQKNAIKHSATIALHEGNLLAPLLDDKYPFSIILANLPYVPNNHQLNQAAMNEPQLAIFGGEDGLDLYRNMSHQIDLLHHKPLYILTESLPFQHVQLAVTLTKHGYKLDTVEDFIQVFKLARPS